MVPRAPTIAWLLAIFVPIAAWIVVVAVAPARLHTLWAVHFADVARERLFIASLAFFGSFGVLRAITYSIHRNAGPFRNIVIRNVHIHHLVWGVLLLLAVGYLWLAQVGLGVGESSRRASALTAILYGVASAVLFGGLLLIGVHGWSFLAALARTVSIR